MALIQLVNVDTNEVVHHGQNLKEYLDSEHETLANLEESATENLSTLNAQVGYLYNDVNKIYESTDTDKTYAAFCDATVALGKEVYVHRVAPDHRTTAGGGNSAVHILEKSNGKVTTKYIIQPIAGYDFRDPSITWEPVTRRLVVTVQNYNAAANTYNGGSIYVFSAAYALLGAYSVGDTGYFQWGKALRTPSGKMLVAAYNVSNAGVRLYTSSGNFDNPGTFSLTATIFNDDASLSRTEVSLHYWKEFLVAVARTQDVATQSLQNLSVTYTRDLSGASGWVAPVRLSLTGVAPRMLTMPDGALVISAGSIFSGYRGSVATILTYDLDVFSSAQTVFRGTTGDGGYHGMILTKDGLAIYSYIESAHLTKAATYLGYFDLSAVQVLRPGVNAPLSFLSSNNCTYIGGAPFGTTASTTGGYISIYIKEAINNCRGLVLNLGGSMSSAQAVILQRADGSTFATLGGVNASSVGTYYASHAGVNIPAGTYRITIAQGYVCTGTRKNSEILSYPSDRIYGLVGINGVPAASNLDVFVGFAV